MSSFFLSSTAASVMATNSEIYASELAQTAPSSNYDKTSTTTAIIIIIDAIERLK